MDIYSELNKAQAENLATDPTAGTKGRFYYKSTTEPLKVDDGTDIHKVVTDRNIATLAAPVIATHAAEVGLTYKNVLTLFKQWTTDQDLQEISSHGRPFMSLDVSASAVLVPFYINTSDLVAVGALTPKLRISANLFTRSNGITSTISLALYPVVAGVIGTAVSGSTTASWVSPGANHASNKVSADFDVPASGFYTLAVTQTGTMVNALSAYATVSATLQTRNT